MLPTLALPLNGQKNCPYLGDYILIVSNMTIGLLNVDEWTSSSSLASDNKHLKRHYYLRQGGYVFVVVCLPVCLSVSNFAQKLPNGFAWSFQGRLANDRILVANRIIDSYRRRALAEVCTVPVLLVLLVTSLGPNTQSLPLPTPQIWPSGWLCSRYKCKYCLVQLGHWSDSGPISPGPNVTDHASKPHLPTSYYSTWHCNCRSE